jgi:AcrR family transcriptional regulator
VIEEAERMVDEVGFEALTLAALAQRLGVKQPSLYKHIDGAASLRRAIVIRTGRQLTDKLTRAAVGRSRGDAIMAIAVAHREWALAHPSRYQLSQLNLDAADPGLTQVAADYVQVFRDVLSGYGLADDDVIDAIRGVRSALHGWIVLEAGGGFAMPYDIDRSFRRLVQTLADALDHWSSEPSK